MTCLIEPCVIDLSSSDWLADAILTSIQSLRLEETPKVYFTSDTHFNSARTLSLSRRPFPDVESMNSHFISQWNDTVNSQDTVYHLGDFGDYSYAHDLNGHIVLLFGNYERENPPYRYSRLFSQLIDDFQFPLPQYDLTLVHEPSHMSTSTFNLFGHVHQLSLVKKHHLSPTQIQCGLNVGIDNFQRPISIDVVEFYRNAVLNHYDVEVFY
ncbi:MAG: hypothetical protein NC114_10620 [Ruminococcus flavefaciens]|nr:hypothetical protein [Ruminococcus flavefaciens]